MYATVHRARVESRAIAVYIANCGQWSSLPKHDAMGYFLDQVVVALNAVGIDPSQPPFNLPATHSSGDNWLIGAVREPLLIARLFGSVVEALQAYEQAPVLLCFDEVQYLYAEETDEKGREITRPRDKPWIMANLMANTRPDQYANGAILASGACDILYASLIRVL